MTHEQECMRVLLYALECYKDYDALPSEMDIIDEQIGALRANLFGEENGWRSKKEQIEWESRERDRLQKIMDDYLKEYKNDK